MLDELKVNEGAELSSKNPTPSTSFTLPVISAGKTQPTNSTVYLSQSVKLSMHHFSFSTFRHSHNASCNSIDEVQCCISHLNRDHLRL